MAAFSGVDKQTQVRRHLRELRTEGKSSKDLRDAIELLIKITRNVLPPKDPGATIDPKFRQINPSNTEFSRKIWNSPAAKKILYLSGWIRQGEGENLRLVRGENTENEANIISGQDLMTILVENRNIVPLEKEWEDTTKIEKILTPDEKYKQDQLRGAEERNAEYAKALKEKKDRKELAENLKKEQMADQAYRNIRNPRTDNQLNAMSPQWDPMRGMRGTHRPSSRPTNGQESQNLPSNEDENMDE